MSERNGFELGAVGETPAVESLDAVVVYDGRDGRVVHQHHVVTFAGAERRSEEQQIEDAVGYARQLGRLEGVEPETLCVRDLSEVLVPSRVDVDSRTLIPLPAPETPPAPSS